jgi:mono/diheme cytochrome c family protein
MRLRHLLAGAILLAPAQIPSSGFAQSANDWQSGEQIFDIVCQYCHQNEVGPVITGRQLPEPYIEVITRNGFRAMPAFRQTELSDDDLAKVAAYVSASEAPQ